MEDILNVIKIRAHHLLCIQGFKGYGYSQSFTSNMAQVINNINSYPNLKVEVIIKCDIICSCCPHNKEEVCQKQPNSNQKAEDMDMYVLRKLNLKERAKCNAKDIFAFANTKIREISDVLNICGGCEWKEKCRWFISRNINVVKTI